jgi:hypothetical protein
MRVTQRFSGSHAAQESTMRGGGCEAGVRTSTYLFTSCSLLISSTSF